MLAAPFTFIDSIAEQQPWTCESAAEAKEIGVYRNTNLAGAWKGAKELGVPKIPS